MASSLLARRSAAISNLFFNKSLQPLRSAASVTRSFNTNAQLRDIDNDEQHNLEVNRRPESGVRRRDSPANFFSDVFDPISPTRTLSQVLNMMDSLMENPLAAAASQGMGMGMGSGLRRGWEAKEEKDALHLRMDMPGLGKEDVKVCVEDGRLSIKGEGGKEGDREDSVRRYSSRIELPANVYKLNEIKAEMKNGVLKVYVPKVKENERKDVLQVNVD